MKLQSLLTRIKATHWTWWILWLCSMVLLGYVILWHRMAGVAGLAEQFRPGHYLLPIEFCVIKNMAEAGVYAVVMSCAFVFAAVIQPGKGSLSMAMAVGVIMLYFAYHTLFFMTISHLYMKGYRQTHAIPEDRAVPGQKTPAKE